MPRRVLDPNTPLLAQLNRWGVEPDQRLKQALRRCAHGHATPPRGVRGDPIPMQDDDLLAALVKVNAVAIPRTSTGWDALLQRLIRENPWVQDKEDANTQGSRPEDVFVSENLALIFARAIGKRTSRRSLTVNEVVDAFVAECLDTADSDVESRPATINHLLNARTGNLLHSLSDFQDLGKFIRGLQATSKRSGDFQYILANEGERIVFRVASVLDDFVERPKSGLLVPQRALFTTFKETFGAFTSDEIGELEELVNSPRVRETDFQKFFEAHTHFFRRWDYREVHAHVYLTRGSQPLVPDFILTNREAQKAAIVELKLPSAHLVRRQDNRDRFASAIGEARAQLLRYRDWFRESQNRAVLKAKVGMEIYEPHLSVIIGRSSEFLDGIDRQRLAADNREIEIVTYDDIAAFARQRRLLLG